MYRGKYLMCQKYYSCFPNGMVKLLKNILLNYKLPYNDIFIIVCDIFLHP